MTSKVPARWLLGFATPLLALSLFAGPAAAEPCLRITEVDIFNDQVTVSNVGDMSASGTYWFCADFIYRSFSLNLAAGASVTVSAGMVLDDNASDLGLYNSASFGSTSAMDDFVQWGSGGNGRESVAVAKGIWSAGDFVPVPGGGVISWLGSSCNDYGASFWEEPVPTRRESFGQVKSEYALR